MGKPQNSDEPGSAYLNLMSALGMALAVLGLGHAFLPHNGEPYEWTQYMLIGGVFPPLLHAAHFFYRYAKTLQVLEVFRWSLAFVALAFCIVVIPGGDIPVLSAFALAQWFVLGGATGWAAHDGKNTARSLFALAALLAVWGLLSRFLWWEPFGRHFFGGPYQFFGTIIAAAFTIWHWRHGEVRQAGASTRHIPRVLVELALVFVLALVALRVPFKITEHHEFYVGSAALVRQGGWLLWDVPSQYGFLDILLLAALPFKSLHFCLYVAASALQMVCALILYGMLRALRPDALGAVAAMVLTIAVAFMVPGGAPELTGLNTYPSTGGMRFLFCYLLLGWSYWNITAENGGGEARNVRFWAGSCLWAAGCFWSFENVIYGTSIWLPQSLWLSWEIAKQRHGAEHAGAWRRASTIFLSSLSPLAILFATVNVCYIFGLGRLPDWYAFIEYAMTYKGGFGAIPIEPRGGVWGLLLVFTAVSVCAAAAFRDRSAAWPALIGIMGLFWSTASYFIWRSAENNILNLAPLHFTCVVAALAAFKERVEPRRILQAVLIPLSAVLLTATWGNPHLPGFLRDTFRMDYESRVNGLLPKAKKPLTDILKEVNYKKGDPLVVVNFMLPPSLTDVGLNGQVDNAEPYRFWLPMAPAAELLLLPPERQLVYISRFARRHRQGGWMVVPHEIPTENIDAFFASINAEYRLMFERHNEEWLVRRYEPR